MWVAGELMSIRSEMKESEEGFPKSMSRLRLVLRFVGGSGEVDGVV